MQFMFALRLETNRLVFPGVKVPLGLGTKRNTVTHYFDPLFLSSVLRPGISSGLTTTILIWAFESPSYQETAFFQRSESERIDGSDAESGAVSPQFVHIPVQQGT